MTEKETKKRKGLLGAIWESMTKTGGCCGPGESCCGPARENDKEAMTDTASKEPDRKTED